MVEKGGGGCFVDFVCVCVFCSERGEGGREGGREGGSKGRMLLVLLGGEG